MKRILLLTVLCIATCGCWAQVGMKFDAVNNDGCKLSYEITSDKTVKLLRKEKVYVKMKKILVPEVVNFKEQSFFVTEIEPGCFRFLSGLEEVSLPDAITELKSYYWDKWKSGDKNSYVDGMFYYCSALKTVKLPAHLKKMEELCFYNCSSLEVIDIPSTVEDIGGGSFYGCKALRNINLPQIQKMEDGKRESNYSGGSLYYSSYWSGLFEGCTSLEYIKIPSSVNSIDGLTFNGCTSLKKVSGLHAGIYYGKSSGYRKAWNDYYPSEITVFNGSSFDFKSVQGTFSYFAEYEIGQELEKWQKKKEFETIDQFRSRVTKENRERKLQELIEMYKEKYIEKAKKEQSPQWNIGNYDSEYNVFPVTDINLGTKYVKVPMEEAPAFKDNFSKATIIPSYSVSNNNLTLDCLEVTINGKAYMSEKAVKEVAEKDISIDLDSYPLDIASISDNRNPTNMRTELSIDNSVDKEIPTVLMDNKKTFAIIIGNEKYTQVAHVPYANNDARIFAEYCKKTLGLPEKNVKVYENASYGMMIGAVSDIQKIAKAFKGDINVIFYYAGHGIPDEATGDGYLLPIDADGLNMRVCYPLSQLYKELGEMQVKSVTCFMDACFSGAQRGNGMVVAARGVAIKVKADHPAGNTVVFTAATDKQTAYPYEEKGHGMFTYYLLKKLRETKGDCTLGELGTYISDEVAKQAIVTNGKEQTPVVLTSQGIADSWKNMKLR